MRFPGFLTRQSSRIRANGRLQQPFSRQKSFSVPALGPESGWTMVTYASIYKSCIVRRWCLVARILTQGWKGRAPGIVQWLTPLVVPWPPGFLIYQVTSRTARNRSTIPSCPIWTRHQPRSLPLSRSRFRTVTARPSRKSFYRSENVIVAIRLAEFVAIPISEKGTTRSWKGAGFLEMADIVRSLLANFSRYQWTNVSTKIHSYTSYF